MRVFEKLGSYLVHIPFSVDMNYCSPSFNLSKCVFIVLHTFIDALDFTDGLGKDSHYMHSQYMYH